MPCSTWPTGSPWTRTPASGWWSTPRDTAIAGPPCCATMPTRPRATACASAAPSRSTPCRRPSAVSCTSICATGVTSRPTARARSLSAGSSSRRSRRSASSGHRTPSVAGCFMFYMTVKQLDGFERGLFVGILIGEGSFGGDGRQPQVTLRMHTRHEALFRWLEARFPRTKVYGPYHHGGRSYFPWMARGRALAEHVLPVVEDAITPEVDAHAAARLAAMRERYADYIARARRPLP